MSGLIARVADGCFWFGRYVERSESSARVLQTTLGLALDGELSPRQCWQPVLAVSGVEPDFLALEGEAAVDDGERVQAYLVWNEDCPVALCRSVAAARANARTIREVLSADAWGAVNEIYLWFGDPAARAAWAGPRDEFYERVRRAAQLNLGLLRSTMLHDLALDFIWLGMLLERVGQTARLLDVHHHALAGTDAHQVVETSVWLALLRACSGVEPFMKAHAGRVTAGAVAAFLVGEARFPRSVAYCVRSARERLAAIRPPDARGLPGGEALARLSALDAWVRASTPGEPGADLHRDLTHVVDETGAICETIARELLGGGPPAPTEVAHEP
ncbi:MAG: alpha-E domain-containing protein [Polyangiaceae bacterium]|nr:alpha-E domain-containing protein [Polyangiaceae bacterium]